MVFERGDRVRYIGDAPAYVGRRGVVQAANPGTVEVLWDGAALPSSHIRPAVALVGRPSEACPAPYGPPGPQGPKGDKGDKGEPGATVFVVGATTPTPATVDDVVALAEQQLARAKQIQKEARKRQSEAERRNAAAALAQKARDAAAERIAKDRELAHATVNLLNEIDRRFKGGDERTADAYISRHIDQLQPLARSHGYKIVKPGTDWAVLVKL